MQCSGFRGYMREVKIATLSISPCFHQNCVRRPDLGSWTRV